MAYKDTIKYKVLWKVAEDFVEYDTLDEVVEEVIKEHAEAHEWQSVEWWGQIMSSGEFEDLPEDEAIKCILGMEDEILEINPVTEKDNK